MKKEPFILCLVTAFSPRMNVQAIKSVLITLLITFSSVLSSQSVFENVYERGGGSGIDTTGDGGVMLCGQTDPDGKGLTAATIISQDKDGAMLWAYSYGNVHPAGFTAIVKCNGGYAATGYAYNSSTEMYDLMYARINSSGTLLAGPIYLGLSDRSMFGNSIIELSNGDFAICGRTDRQQMLLRMSSDVLDWIRIWGTNESPYLNATFKVLELPSTDLVVLGESNEFQTNESNWDVSNLNVNLTRFTSTGTLDSLVAYSIEDKLAFSGYDFVRVDDQFYITGQLTSEFSSTICIRGMMFQVDTTFVGQQFKQFSKIPGQIITKISTCTGMGIVYSPVADAFVITGYILDDATLLPQYNGFLGVFDRSFNMIAFNAYGEKDGNQFFTKVVVDSNAITTVGIDWNNMGLFSSLHQDWYSIKTLLDLRSCNEIRTPYQSESADWFQDNFHPEPTTPEPNVYNDEAAHEVTQRVQLCFSEGEGRFNYGGTSQQKISSTIINTCIYNTLGQTVMSKEGVISWEEMQTLQRGVYVVVTTDLYHIQHTEKKYITK